MKTKLTKIAVAATFVFASGCASQQTTNTAVAASNVDTSAIEAKLNSRSTNLDAREAELRQREAAVAASGMKSVGGDSDLLPPGAAAGECYARIWQPATYKTITEKVLQKEASERVQVIPAQYTWDTKTIEVSAASSKIITTPAVYGTTTERRLVSDARTIWRRTLNTNSAEVTSSLLSLAKSHGADIDSARPGTCFHEHTIPATFKTESDKVLVSEASETVVAVPATYRTAQKTITVSEASTKIVQVPATYKDVSEKVLVKPAHTTWKRGRGPIQKIDSATGEIMCLIEVPAEYKTVTKRVVATPATTKTMVIPAVTKTISVREEATSATTRTSPISEKYKTVTRRVQATDAGVTWHEIHNNDHPTSTRTGQQVCLTEEPAQYTTVTKRVIKVPASSRTVVIPAKSKTVKVKRVAVPASEKRVTIPATYSTLTRQELVKDGHMQWRSILCDTNTTTVRVAQIQKALQAKGFNPGRIDGVIGSGTVSAINAFQRANGLPVDKYLNVETVKALGVSVR